MEISKPEIWAVLPAGGSGQRFSKGLVDQTPLNSPSFCGEDSITENKLLALIKGKPVFTRTLSVFLKSPLITGIVFSVQAAFMESFQQLAHIALKEETLLSEKPFRWVAGGASRRESVYRGLQALPSSCQWVVVHDVARPLLTDALLTRCLKPLQTEGTQAVVLGIPCTDTLKQINMSQTIITTLDRTQIWRAQTPQAFQKDLLLKAHQQVDNTLVSTDDAQLVEFSGLAPVQMVLGCERNLKITTPFDLALAEILI